MRSGTPVLILCSQLKQNQHNCTQRQGRLTGFFIRKNLTSPMPAGHSYAGSALKRGSSLFTLLLLLIVCSSHAAAQNGKQQRVADLAFRTEMERDVNACPEAQTVTDQDVCLNDARVETYKNYTTFFDALREALIQGSPNDDNALALDRTEVVWEKYRVTACDALVKVYDTGTVKHPGPIGPSAQTRCLITLTRSRMRELKQLYEPTL